MSYRFTCRESGDVLMLQADGDALLRTIGREPAAKGILETAAMPAAIAAIEQAIAGDEQRWPALGSSLDDDEVTLRQRSWPLLSMLKSAQAAAVVITWGV